MIELANEETIFCLAAADDDDDNDDVTSTTNSPNAVLHRHGIQIVKYLLSYYEIRSE